jgi:ribosomal protein S18 acetylase RimI-like enzyme
MTLAERIAARLSGISTERFMFGLFGEGRMGEGGFGKLQILGKTKHVTRCQNCGRAGLKHAVVCAVVGEDGHPTNQYYYFGTDCAAKLAGKAEKDVEAEAEHQESSGRPRMKNLKPTKPNEGQMELSLRFAAAWQAHVERYGRVKPTKGQAAFDFDAMASAPQAEPAAGKPAAVEPPALPSKGKQMGLFDQPQAAAPAAKPASDWDEKKHPRWDAGDKQHHGGQFAPAQAEKPKAEVQSEPDYEAIAKKAISEGKGVLSLGREMGLSTQQHRNLWATWAAMASEEGDKSSMPLFKPAARKQEAPAEQPESEHQFPNLQWTPKHVGEMSYLHGLEMEAGGGLAHLRPSEKSRITAAKRSLTQERNKKPLFAEQIKEVQETPEARVAKYDDKYKEMKASSISSELASWKRLDEKLDSMPEADRKKILEHISQRQYLQDVTRAMGFINRDPIGEIAASEKKRAEIAAAKARQEQPAAQPAQFDFAAIVKEARAKGQNIHAAAREAGVPVTHENKRALMKAVNDLPPEEPKIGPGQARGQAKFNEARAKEERPAEFNNMTPIGKRLLEATRHMDDEKFKKFIREAAPVVRMNQARLMAQIDYDGLMKAKEFSGQAGFTNPDMPLLWPHDAATFPQANNPPAMNTTKPGDLLWSPTFSGTPALLQVVSRNGKKQKLKIISGPDEMMVGKTIDWHADQNNVMFREATAKEAKLFGPKPPQESPDGLPLFASSNTKEIPPQSGYQFPHLKWTPKHIGEFNGPFSLNKMADPEEWPYKEQQDYVARELPILKQIDEKLDAMPEADRKRIVEHLVQNPALQIDDHKVLSFLGNNPLQQIDAFERPYRERAAKQAAGKLAEPAGDGDKESHSLADEARELSERASRLVERYSEAGELQPGLKGQQDNHPHWETPEFKSWFGQSKAVQPTGKPLRVFHGSKRPDRIGSEFKANRATSGPMSFFTDDPDIASSYATGKRDTSLEMPESYAGWFKYKPQGSRGHVSLDHAWYHLPHEQKQAALERLPHVNINEEGEISHKHGQGTVASGWDWYLKREGQGNPIKAARAIWLDSGTLFNDEHRFLEVLKHAGIDTSNFHYESPWHEQPGVHPAWLSIQNPLDTANIPDHVHDALHAAGRLKRGKTGSGADQWDKRHVSGRDWLQRLAEDKQNGTAHAWTSIPDWATKTLKSLGYDGIKDMGGKYGGPKHSVWIPFGPHQIKSAMGNRGTYDSGSKKITYGAGGQVERYSAGHGFEELLARAAKYTQKGEGYNRNIHASANRVKSMLAQGRHKEAAHWAEELKLRLDGLEPKPATNLFGEAVEPAPQPAKQQSLLDSQGQGLLFSRTGQTQRGLFGDDYEAKPLGKQESHLPAPPEPLKQHKPKPNQQSLFSAVADAMGVRVERYQNSIEEWMKQTEAEHPEAANLFASERDNAIHLHNIEINKANRGKGIGSQIVAKLQAYAQKKQKPITLEAESEPGKKGALDRFYKSAGFQKPGRRRDYSLPAGHTHIWRPKTENHSAGASIERYAAEQAPSPWFLKSRELLKQKMGQHAPASQVLALLKNNQISPEELEWTGLEKHLRAKGNNPVSQQELHDLIGKFGVEESVLGDKGYSPNLRKFIDDTGWRPDVDGPLDSYIWGMSAEAHQAGHADAAEDLMNLGNEAHLIPSSSEPKYGKYSLPGGANYREMLLRLPDKSGSPLSHLELTALSDLREVAQRVGHQNLGALQQEYDELLGRRNAQEQGRKQNYHSSHWDDPNVLAHVRYKDYTGPDGKKHLHIDEIQSDWHQQGRKDGYDIAMTPERQAEYDRLSNELLQARKFHSEDIDFIKKQSRKGLADDAIEQMLKQRQASPERQAAAQKERELSEQLKAYYPKENAAPDAPFKKNWHMLAMKRMLHHAAANGYDRVTWTPGEEHADRYNLQKHVALIVHEPSTGKINVLGHDGSPVLRGSHKDGVFQAERTGPDRQFHGKPLHEIFGHEVTEKLLKAEPDSFTGHAAISGDDLKIGGTGMRAFYDQMLPADTNKLIKRHGGKVGQFDLHLPDHSDGGGFETKPPRAIKVHGFDITPSMKAEATGGKGQSMFSVYEEPGLQIERYEQTGANPPGLQPRFRMGAGEQRAAEQFTKIPSTKPPAIFSFLGKAAGLVGKAAGKAAGMAKGAAGQAADKALGAIQPAADKLAGKIGGAAESLDRKGQAAMSKVGMAPKPAPTPAKAPKAQAGAEKPATQGVKAGAPVRLGQAHDIHGNGRQMIPEGTQGTYIGPHSQPGHAEVEIGGIRHVIPTKSLGYSVEHTDHKAIEQHKQTQAEQAQKQKQLTARQRAEAVPEGMEKAERKSLHVSSHDLQPGDVIHHGEQGAHPYGRVLEVHPDGKHVVVEEATSSKGSPDGIATTGRRLTILGHEKMEGGGSATRMFHTKRVPDEARPIGQRKEYQEFFEGAKQLGVHDDVAHEMAMQLWDDSQAMRTPKGFKDGAKVQTEEQMKAPFKANWQQAQEAKDAKNAPAPAQSAPAQPAAQAAAQPKPRHHVSNLQAGDMIRPLKGSESKVNLRYLGPGSSKGFIAVEHPQFGKQEVSVKSVGLLMPKQGGRKVPAMSGRDQMAERAAIMQFDGGLNRKQAARAAVIERGRQNAPDLHQVKRSDFAMQRQGVLAKDKQGNGFLLYGGKRYPLSPAEFDGNKLASDPVKIRERIHREQIKALATKDPAAVPAHVKAEYEHHFDRWAGNSPFAKGGGKQPQRQSAKNQPNVGQMSLSPGMAVQPQAPQTPPVLQPPIEARRQAQRVVNADPRGIDTEIDPNRPQAQIDRREAANRAFMDAIAAKFNQNQPAGGLAASPPPTQPVVAASAPPAVSNPAQEQKTPLWQLTRPHKMGRNEVNVQFDSAKQRDLHDYAASVANARSFSGKAGRGKPNGAEQQRAKLKAVADAHFGGDMDAAHQEALQVRAHVKAHMAGAQDGDHRVIPPLGVQPAQPQAPEQPAGSDTMPWDRPAEPKAFKPASPEKAQAHTEGVLRGHLKEFARMEAGKTERLRQLWKQYRESMGVPADRRFKDAKQFEAQVAGGADREGTKMARSFDKIAPELAKEARMLLGGDDSSNKIWEFLSGDPPQALKWDDDELAEKFWKRVHPTYAESLERMNRGESPLERLKLADFLSDSHDDWQESSRWQDDTGPYQASAATSNAFTERFSAAWSSHGGGREKEGVRRSRKLARRGG